VPQVTGRLWISLGAFCGVTWALSAAAAVPPGEDLLPETTKGFLCVTNVPKLREEWNKTQLGHLMNDKAMEPFSKDLRRQFEDRLSDLRDRLGLTLDDLQGVPSGELCVALIQPGPDQAARAILMDVTGRLDRAKAMLEKAAANQRRRGGKESKFTVGGATAIIFTVPRQPNELEGPPHEVAYFLKDNLVGAADNHAIMKGILSRAAGQKGPCLAAVKSFMMAMERCRRDADKQVPLIRWYVQPLGYIETARAATPEQDRRKGKSIAAIMRNQGFAGLQGVAGYINLNLGRYEILHRTAVYAPPPYEKSMKMLVLPNAKDFTPQRWVPRDVATYLTFYCDILNAFDNFGPLFDELFGEENEKGIWGDVLKSLEEDPNGPRLNLRKELISFLDQRVTVVADYQMPITVNSERMLYAIQTKDEKAVTAAMTKWMQGDPSSKKREFKGHIIWEMIEPEEPEVPKISLGDVPPVIPTVPEPPKRVLGKRDEDEEAKPFLPHAAVTVAHGHLFIATHLDFLIKILELAEERKTLARDIDFQIVRKQADQLGFKEQSSQAFSRTDEEYRTTYELMRQGKMAESETMLARVVNAIAGPPKRGEVRKQRIDGSQLPDYEIVRRYLGTAGLKGVSEKDGWFFKGFLLNKQTK